MAATSAMSFWEFKGIDEYNDNRWLMSSPYPTMLILVCYLWFVLKAGPNYMKDREPFDLRNWLVGYNALQVLVTAATFLGGAQFLWQKGLWHTTCYADIDQKRWRWLNDGEYYYYLTKIVELVDTVFFVLRKKQRQVTFLHVYHHSMMAMATWCVTKYTKTDAVVFIGTSNSLVHVVMYTYYGLAAFPQLHKYLWWKKYITMMQLIQFTLMFLHVTVSHNVSECRPAYYLVSAVCFNTLLFMYLFGDFYVKSYMKNYKTSDIVNAGKKIGTNIGKNGIVNDIMSHHKLASKIQ